MLPEEKARVKIDKQLRNAGWDIVARNEYLPNSTSAVKEALMGGNTESDYLLFIDGKAIAVVEAKREENPLGDEVKKQAEDYAVSPQDWYGLWFEKLIPLVYMANGNKIYFKNMLVENSDYEELPQMHSPKKMLQIVGKKSEYGALPLIEKRGLRDCQYRAEVKFEESLKMGNKKNLAVLATGSGKTYLACLASYRLLNYTPTKRILFLVDRNNLARQTESEFSVFDRTEGQQKMGNLYTINRLKKEEDIKGDIVISTIQKLFCVLTGQEISDSDEDAEDEKVKADEEKDSKTVVDLGNDLKLPQDYFQLIIVDECHRSIYGKWKKVLDYFSEATVLGLTATPTPEAYAYFNKNVIEEYTYDDSVVDGVNVPPRIYRIITDVTAHGGTIEKGAKITETSKRTGKSEIIDAGASVEYGAAELDRSVVNKKQIKEVLMAYKKAIYEDLYPSREQKWEYIPKTLIFAKDDNHATEIVDIAKDVFKSEFENDAIPEKFVQKITYSAGDSNALIRDLRTEKDFRIAVTVTLVATGTDVKPLEVVLFMKDVHSDVLYTQMKGRGCRVMPDYTAMGDVLKNVASEGRFPGKDVATWLRAVMNTTDKIKVQAEMDIVIPHIDVNAEYTKADVMGLFKGITTKKEVVRYVFENTGIMLYAYLRGEEERREYLSGNIDINYFDNDDTHAKYSVGEIGNGMKYTIERASVVREIQAVDGSKLFFKKLLPLMGVEFVRYGMLTVVPFPFKYLREYIATNEQTCVLTTHVW